MEYKQDEFAPVYAGEDDQSAVGVFEEGDKLYVMEGGETDAVMREIRVRLHGISGKPFVDISPTVGMELGFLRPEHRVYAHASHRAFERVRSHTPEVSRKTEGPDAFTLALTNLLTAREAAQKAAKPLENVDSFTMMCRRFQLHVVDKRSGTLVYAVSSQSEAAMHEFGNIFLTHLSAKGVVCVASERGGFRKVLSKAMARQLFFLIAKKLPNGEFENSNLHPQFYDKVNSGWDALEARVLGVIQEGNFFIFGLDFTLL